MEVLVTGRRYKGSVWGVDNVLLFCCVLFTRVCSVCENVTNSTVSMCALLTMFLKLQ